MPAFAKITGKERYWGGGRLVFPPNPEKGIYTFTGKASCGRLLSGVAQNVWWPRGDSNTRHAV
jgi:hypothetical protein